MGAPKNPGPKPVPGFGWSWDLPRRVGLSLHVHLSHGSDLIAFRCEAGHSPLHYSHLPHHLLAAGKKWRRNKGNARETVHSIIPAIFTLCLHQWLTLYFPLPLFLDTLAVLHVVSLWFTFYNALAQRTTPRESAWRGPSLQRQALISLDIFADVGVVQPPDLLPGPQAVMTGMDQLHNVGKAINHPQNNHKWVRIL